MARWIVNQVINHMPGIEIGVISNRTMLPKDAASVSLAGPVVDVVATAKIDLAAGTLLDRFGGFLTHGLCENAATVQTARLLPMSIAEGARLRRTVAKDSVLNLDDVDLPLASLACQPRAEQDTLLAYAEMGHSER
jgi:predicted homoserine dehydrogenase-like protein